LILDGHSSGFAGSSSCMQKKGVKTNLKLEGILRKLKIIAILLLLLLHDFI